MISRDPVIVVDDGSSDNTQRSSAPSTSSFAAEVVYDAESRIRRPRELLAVLCRDLVASRELAWRFMVRDLRAQYRQAALGVAWAFVPPLLLAAGATLASRAQVINVGATDLPYPAYVMFSTALWQTFVEALNGPAQAMASAKAMPRGWELLTGLDLPTAATDS